MFEEYNFLFYPLVYELGCEIEQKQKLEKGIISVIPAKVGIYPLIYKYPLCSQCVNPYNEPMRSYSKSFFITEPISNNYFDYGLRSHPAIHVPSLIEGDLDDVKIADSIAIETFVGEKLVSGKGLEHCVFLRNARVPTWICDNHNHAFVFWHEALQGGYIQHGSLLVHIDQHTDLATPMVLPVQNTKSKIQNDINEKNPSLCILNSVFCTLSEVEEYTNTVLTIADFIVPALSTGLVSEALMVTGEAKEGVGTFIWEDNQLKKISSSQLGTCHSELVIPSTLIVDLDLDYFSQGFDENETFSTVQYWLRKADIITIATSPLFIDQHKALSILKSLQKELLLL